jgi:hypothetical protein
MIAWLSANWGTVVVAAVVVAIVGVVVWRMIADKKAGKSSCGCGCEGCAMKDQCHK